MFAKYWVGDMAMSEKRGPGRIPLPDAERRRNRVTIQLTDAELEALRQVAQGARESVALYARSALLRHLAAKRRKR